MARVSIEADVHTSVFETSNSETLGFALILHCYTGPMAKVIPITPMNEQQT